MTNWCDICHNFYTSVCFFSALAGVVPSPLLPVEHSLGLVKGAFCQFFREKVVIILFSLLWLRRSFPKSGLMPHSCHRAVILIARLQLLNNVLHQHPSGSSKNPARRFVSKTKQGHISPSRITQLKVRCEEFRGF